MPTRMSLATAVTVATLTITAAHAENPAVTGTGDGPATTVTAPHTTSIGQTKPPGAAAGAEPNETRERRTDQMKKDDKIMKGICVGCGTK